MQDDIIEEATEETKSKDYTLLPNELKIAMELGGVEFSVVYQDKDGSVLIDWRHPYEP